MTAKQKVAMYEAIEEHGKKLLAMFPNAKEKDPVRLCKRLRVYEGKVRQGLHLINTFGTVTWVDLGNKYINQGVDGANRLLGTKEEISYDEYGPHYLICDDGPDHWMYVAPDLSPTGEYTNGITGYAVKRGTQ